MRHGRRGCCAHEQAGFTLVEILLALFMFSIIAGAIFASFSAVVDGVERGRVNGEFYRIGRTALQRMAQEVGAALTFADDPRTTMRGENGSADKQPRDRITFVTIPYRRFPATLPANELCDVSYYIEQNAQGTPALFRTEDCTLDEERQEGGVPVELTDAVVGLDITYFDAEGAHDDWPSNREETGPLPCRVRLALTLRLSPEDERAFVTTVVLPMRGACDGESQEN
jgi:general secretion pathway protein J